MPRNNCEFSNFPFLGAHEIFVVCRFTVIRLILTIQELCGKVGDELLGPGFRFSL